MKIGKKIDWQKDTKEISQIDHQGTLDESDAHLYEQVIKNMSAEKKQRKKQEDQNPQKISEYYQNFCKKNNQVLKNSSNLTKKSDSAEKGFKKFQSLKDFTAKRNQYRLSITSKLSKEKLNLQSKEKSLSKRLTGTNRLSSKKFNLGDKVFKPKEQRTFKRKKLDVKPDEQQVWLFVKNLSDLKLKTFVEEINSCKLIRLSDIIKQQKQERLKH